MSYVPHSNDTTAETHRVTKITDFGTFVQMQQQKSEAAEEHYVYPVTITPSSLPKPW